MSDDDRPPRAPAAAADPPELTSRVRESDDPGIDVCDVYGITQLGLQTIDALARLQLAARRQGRRLALGNASPELRELLELAGLCRVLPCADADLSGVQPRRQVEEREEPRGVEEERDAADPGP
jgi:STAS domain